MPSDLPAPLRAFLRKARDCRAGLILAAVVAAAAHFSSERLGGPPMVHALVLGLFLGFLASEPGCSAGLDFASRSVLRFGIALLGFNLSLAALAELGLPVLLLVVGLVALSIALGFWLARLFGCGREVALVAACATSICGGSATLAVAAILDDDGRLQPAKCAIIAAIALLGTGAMFVYPPLLLGMGLDGTAAGIVLGASIHDLPLAVSAGYSVSDDAGGVATLVKLVRVACLLPVIALISLGTGKALSGRSETGRKTLVPGFMLAFLALILVNSFLPVPSWLSAAAGDLSKGCLIVAVAAIGVQTSMRHIVLGSTRLVAVLVLQAALLFGLSLAGVWLLGR